MFRHRSKNRGCFTRRGLPHQVLLRAGVALLLLSVCLPLPAQGAVAAEYRLKAIYLANLSSFVEWPQETWQPGKDSFLVCVFGEFSFGTSLAELTRGKTVHNQRIEIRWVQKRKELSACQILFVTRSQKKRYNEILDFVRSGMVLTVGETPDFLDAGGILSFSDQPGSVQFDVNLEAANKAHLKISSQLLALARRVVNRTEDAKS